MKMIQRLLAAAAGALALATPAALAAEAGHHPADYDFSFEGPFGTFDRAQLQRGFLVYQQVCSACHSMNQLHIRNLGEEGGPFYSEEYPNPNDNPVVRAIAADYIVEDGPDEYGDMFERPGLPKDAFKSPFENEQLAKLANGGALPPDLSLMTKARDGGADYLYSLLTGYEDAPAGFEVGPGLNYNVYFPGHQIAMAQPIYEDSVSYADGTPATVEQMSKDVTAFLHWAAEPKLEARKQTGFMVMTFLVILAGLLYFTQRKIWSDQH